MTRTFTYTFNVLTKKEGTDGHKQENWFAKEITLKKKVTDKMEERYSWKAVYAANYFTEVTRKEYGKKVAVSVKNIKEI